MSKPGKQEQARGRSPTRQPGLKLHEKIEAAFSGEVELLDAVDPATVIRSADKFLEIMRFLRSDPALRFDFLRSVTGVDWPNEERIDSVYHLFSYELGHAHVIHFRCHRAQPEVPSVESIWPTANWFEREVYDLHGIAFVGHSDLRRIMLPDDWTGHPLRKDYVEEAEYRGIGTTRASPLAAFAEMDAARRSARSERGESAPEPLRSSIEPPPGWQDPKAKSKTDAKESP